MRRYAAHCCNLVGSVREEDRGYIWNVAGHGGDPWTESSGMTPAWKQPRLVFLFLSVLVLFFANVRCAATEGALFAGEEKPGLGSRDASPCGSAAEAWPEGQLKQRIASDGSSDGASDVATGPCIRQTVEPVLCPVKCFRAYPVCGTDKVTYWCGVADAKCAGVEVAHNGYCNLWELDTNVGSTTALRAAQSLQQMVFLPERFHVDEVMIDALSVSHIPEQNNL